MLQLVLNIPHSSTYVPSGVKRNEEMDAAIRETTDWFTEQLFGNHGYSRILNAVFPYSRCYCDVGRLIDDPLAAEGRGIIYDFSLEISTEDRFRRLYLYNRHLDTLHAMITMGNTFLLDCHSFSTASEFDICLGFNDDCTRPDNTVVEAVKRYFEHCGLKVGINEPYSNAITVDFVPKSYIVFDRSPRPYQSMMIKINQRLYLDMATKQKNANFENIRWIIQRLYQKLRFNRLREKDFAELEWISVPIIREEADRYFVKSKEGVVAQLDKSAIEENHFIIVRRHVKISEAMYWKLFKP